MEDHGVMLTPRFMILVDSTFRRAHQSPGSSPNWGAFSFNQPRRDEPWVPICQLARFFFFAFLFVILFYFILFV